MGEVRGGLSPKALYTLGIEKLAKTFDIFKNDIRCLSANVLFDVYFKLYKDDSLSLLGEEFINLEIFQRLLKLSESRVRLHECFQALEEHGIQVGKALAISYELLVKKYLNCPCLKSKVSVVDNGFRLGSFLFDAAWFDKAEKVLLSCKELCESLESTPITKTRLLLCCHKLLRVQSAFFKLSSAQETYHQILVLIEDLKRMNHAPQLTGIYSVFSYYFFTKNEFDEALRYSKAALQKLQTERICYSSGHRGVPLKTVVEVLRQASRSSVVKREFTNAGLLARHAVALAEVVYGTDHPKYADALLDYGFFLLYYDSIQQCVEVCERAYQIKTSVFKKDNLNVALTLEDLAYGLYVREYSSGRFELAKEKSEESVRIMRKLLPHGHLMLSSALRVKALILEEIAIDNANEQSELLKDAEKLHMSALNISVEIFGYKNVQTAKHYGNLGRLYQTMEKYHQAEEMHLKAIAIKEELLGPDDYEVGLSVGHLASLYNYHLKDFSKAIDLYLRSISINLKLFGEGYTGLEYDYRGMIHVFMNLKIPQKVAEYTFKLNAWKIFRANQLQKNNSVLVLPESLRPLHEILEEMLKDSSDSSECLS